MSTHTVSSLASLTEVELFDREIQDAFSSAKLLEMYPHHPHGGVSQSLLTKYLFDRTMADRTKTDNFPTIIHLVVEYMSSQEQIDAIEHIEELKRTLIHSLCEVVANDARWQGSRSWNLIRFLHPNTNDEQARDPQSLGMHKLAAAAYFGKKMLVQTLIEEGIRDTEGMTYIGTPLQCAAKGGNPDVMRLLIEQTGNKVDSGLSGRNLLPAAALAGHTDVVCLLLETQNGCIQDKKVYEEALLQAARGGHQQLIEVIKRSAKISPLPSVENQILYQAARYGHEKVIRVALDNGADVNICDRPSKRTTPISFAASLGHKHAVQLLLARGANQHRPYRGATLSMAAGRGFQSVVQVLLDDGKYDFNDPEINNRAGLSPLTAAAGRGQADMIRFILERGIDLVRYREVGETAIASAAGKGHDSVVRMLLEAGVDANGRDETKSPMLAALCHGHDHIVKTLEESGARKVDPEKSIYAAKFKNGTFPTRIRVAYGGVYIADYKH